MYYSVIALILFINLIAVFPYRKKLQIGSIVTFIIIAVFLSKVTDTPDINNYIYLYTSTYTKDIGFSLIAHYFYGLGWSYYQFQTVYMLIGLCLFEYALIRMELPIKRVVIYLLYLLYPFLLNVVQIRNFLVMALVLLAFSVTYKENRKILRYLKWCIVIGVAATQHLMALAYLPFIFLCDKQYVFRKFIKIFMPVTVIFAVFPDSIIAFLNRYLVLIAGESRLAGYSSTTVIGRYFNILAVFLILAIGYTFFRFMKQAENESELFFYDVHGMYQYAEKLLNLLLYNILLCPFLLVNANFARLVQNLFPLIYIGIVLSVYVYRRLPLKRVNSLVFYRNRIIIALTISIPLFSYYTYTLWIELYDTVVVRIFNSL